MSRSYRLGKRQASVAGTRAAILAAARSLVAEGPATLSVGAVARLAGVSRITVYNQFGAKAQLMERLAQRPMEPLGAELKSDPRDELRACLLRSCAGWAADAALYRNLDPALLDREVEGDRRLAERLSEADALRPGCSIKEAEDVIGILTSFAVFDRLHKGGRRPGHVVADVLYRLAGAILASA